MQPAVWPQFRSAPRAPRAIVTMVIPALDYAYHVDLGLVVSGHKVQPNGIVQHRVDPLLDYREPAKSIEVKLGITTDGADLVQRIGLRER